MAVIFWKMKNLIRLIKCYVIILVSRDFVFAQSNMNLNAVSERNILKQDYPSGMTAKEKCISFLTFKLNEFLKKSEDSKTTVSVKIKQESKLKFWMLKSTKMFLGWHWKHEENRRRNFEKGGNSFFKKPFNINAKFKKIENFGQLY